MNNSRSLRLLIRPRVKVPTKQRIVKTQILSWGKRQTIEYQVATKERVTAYLLIPRTLSAPAPAVIASHQHAGEWHLGKTEPAGLSGDEAMHYGVELCQQGYVVLCPDHLGFEDRQAAEFPESHPTPLSGRKYEEFILVDQLLHGSSLAAKYTHDLCQALDVLESLPMVDAKRLGTMGHSLGGQTSAWLAFFDRRVKVAFCSCGFSTLRVLQKRRILHNLAAYVPGLLEAGDMDHVIASISPRAFGMSHGKADAIFPIEGVRQITRKAREKFPADKLLAIQFDGGHEFPAEVKARAYAFIARQFNDGR